jgi:hypothetical protein
MPLPGGQHPRTGNVLTVFSRLFCCVFTEHTRKVAVDLLIEERVRITVHFACVLTVFVSARLPVLLLVQHLYSRWTVFS